MDPNASGEPRRTRRVTRRVLRNIDTLFFRIYFLGTQHPSVWNRFPSYGPHGPARFVHLEPMRMHDEVGILYPIREIKMLENPCDDTRTDPKMPSTVSGILLSEAF